MTTRETMIRAGAELRRRREELHITQQEMEKRTAEKYGDDSRVYAQQVSRIEKGGLDKPPILDLLRMGGVMGYSPDDIAEMFDLWPRSARGEQLDPRLRAAVELAEELPHQEREKFLDWIQFAVLQARAERRSASKSSNMPVAEAPAAVPNPPSNPSPKRESRPNRGKVAVE